jgi:DNA-binding SARP family transcriptional activator/tetratricopeptide (TPR) repeat protein
MEILLLGPVEARTRHYGVTVGPPQQRAVLVGLAVDAGRVVPVDSLVARVWGDEPPQHARRTLHTHVTRIRRLLERAGDDHPARLVHHSGGYALQVAPGTVDLQRFEDLVERSRTAGLPLEEAATRLTQALALWRGEPLAGVPGEWAARIRDRCRQQRLDALVSWATVAVRLGRPQSVLRPLGDLVDEHPLAEAPVAVLMRALSTVGRPADALALYAVTRRRLAEELGVDPGPELRQVHQTILRGGADDAAPARSSISVPASPGGPADCPAQLPLGIPGFTGRAAELSKLDGLLSAAREEPTAVVVAVLSGTAGVGKTALALHWAQRVRDEFPDGQLYVDLRGFDPVATPISHDEAVLGFLRALEVPRRRVPAGLAAQVNLYRSVLSGRRVLVVLDNARDAEQVRPLLPGSPGCLVVVTSRDKLPSLVVAEGAYSIMVELMSEDDARLAFSRRVGAARAAAEPAAVGEIVARCAGLPLALSIVSARAAMNPGFPLRALADELRPVGDTLDALAGLGKATDVRAVFSWSYRTLSPAAARLFRLLGLHAGPDIAAAAAASLASVPVAGARRLLAELAQAHMISEYAPGRYRCHDLLRVYASELTRTEEPSAERDQAVQRMLDHYLHTAHAADRLLNPHSEPLVLPAPTPGTVQEYPAEQEAALAWLRAEHHALLGAVDAADAGGYPDRAWRMAGAVASFLAREGHWHDAVAVHERALRAARRAGDPRGRAHAHRNLGRAYAVLGSPQAHHHLGRALDLFAALGDEVYQALTHRNLAWLFEQSAQNLASLHHNQLALELFRAVGHRSGEARALNAVGWDQARLGHHRETLTYCTQAIVLLRELKDRHGEAVTWDSLGYAYHCLGDHEGATDCYHRALVLLGASGDRYNEAQILTHLGDAQQLAGDVGAAREAWTQALAILDGLGHPGADRVRAMLIAVDPSTAAGAPGSPV